MYKELILGCGHRKLVKNIEIDGSNKFQNPTTLDMNPDCKPDVLFDLNELAYGMYPKNLPFKDEEFDEIHAYDVLEHVGKQGDYNAFFREFKEYWRILKWHGLFVATCPKWNSKWAWGDPGHTRIITPNTVRFLQKSSYDELGTTSLSDYRRLLNYNFNLIALDEEKLEDSYLFVLQKEK